MIFLPGGDDAPNLFGAERVYLVVFLHRAPIRHDAVDAAMPGVPTLRWEFVAKAPLDGQRTQAVAVLVGYFSNLFKGIEDDVWGGRLEAVVEEPAIGFSGVKPSDVVADKTVVGVEQFPQVQNELPVVGLVASVSGIIRQGAADYFLFLGPLP